mgnify:CR=1 FL=1
MLDGRVTNDWVKLFANDRCVPALTNDHQYTQSLNATQRHTSRLKDGSRIRVVQASWMETSVAVYSDAGTGPAHTGHRREKTYSAHACIPPCAQVA